jgi:hypothetical protein
MEHDSLLLGIANFRRILLPASLSTIPVLERLKSSGPTYRRTRDYWRDHQSILLCVIHNHFYHLSETQLSTWEDASAGFFRRPLCSGCCGSLMVTKLRRLVGRNLRVVVVQ